MPSVVSSAKVDVTYSTFNNISFARSSLTGVTAGRHLLVAIFVENTATISSTNSDFTHIPSASGSRATNSEDMQVSYWWREITASEPTDYQFTWSGADSCGGMIYVIDGAKSGNPVNIAGTTNGRSTTLTFPQITPTVANCLVIYTEGNWYWNAVSTPDGSPAVTLLITVDGDGGDPLEAHYYTQTTATQTPARTATMGSTHNWVTSALAIEPDSASPQDITVNPVALNLSPQALTVNLPDPPQTAVNAQSLNMSPQSFTVQPGPAETTVNVQSLTLLPQPFTVQPGGTETAVNPATVNLSPQPLTVTIGTLEYETVINPAVLNLLAQPSTIDVPDTPETAVNPAVVILSPQPLTVDLPNPPQTAVNVQSLNIAPQPFTVQPGTAETAVSPVTVNLSPQPFTVEIPDAQETAVNPATLGAAPQPFTVDGGVLPQGTIISPVTLNLGEQALIVEIVTQPQETTINSVTLGIQPNPVAIYNPGTAILIGDATPLPLSVDSISLTRHEDGTHEHEIVSSSNPGANAVILQTDVSGYLQLTRLGVGVTPTEALDVSGNIQLTGVLQHPNDLVIDPAGDDVLLRTADLAAENWVSGTTGWGVTYAGNADFRNITADTLTVEAFISDINLALAGSQIITKSLAIISRNFTVPSGNATLYVYDLPGFADTAVFADGDYVRLRFINIGTGLVVGDAWGTVDQYADLNEGEQSWRWTRISGTVGQIIYEGATALDYGQSGDGYWHVTTLDPAGSPYAEIGTWATDPSVPGNHTIHTRLGQLDGIAGLGDEWGLWSGQDAQHYLVASDTNLEAHGMRLSLYDGVFERIRLDPTVPSFAIGDPLPTSLAVGDGLWVGKHITNDFHLRIGAANAQRLEWDSNDITLYNSSDVPMIVLDASGQSYFAGPMSIGSSGGIWQGSGSFASPVTGLKLWNVGGIGRLAGYQGGTLQAEFATDGSIKAGNGAVVLDDDGVTLNASVGKYSAASLDWMIGATRYFSIGTETDLGSVTRTYIEALQSRNLELTAANIYLSPSGGAHISSGLSVGAAGIPASDDIWVNNDARIYRGLVVGESAVTPPAQGAIQYTNNLRPKRNGTVYTAYPYVPVFNVATNTSWDGNDNKAAGNYTITVSNWSGIPAGCKAVSIHMRGQPTASNCVVYLGGGTNPFYVWQFLSAEVNNTRQISTLAPLNASGQFVITIQNAAFNSVTLNITGYYI